MTLAEFIIEDCFVLTNRGIVLAGKLISGKITIGNKIEFELKNQLISKKITGVEMIRTQFSMKMDNFGILITDLNEIEKFTQNILQGTLAIIK